MRTAVVNVLCEMAQADERIWLLSGDLGFSVLEDFVRRFPQRFVNIGVAEQNMAGIAAGLAMSGKQVFMYSMVNFSTLRCLEQIRNDICYHNLPVKIIGIGGGFWYGTQGYTHYGIEDILIMGSLPNITVVVPADSMEAGLAMREVMTVPGPSYIRIERCNEFFVHKDKPDFRVGKGIELRAGKDIMIISTGALLEEAVKAADILSGRNIRAGVCSMPFIRPLDRDIIMNYAGRYSLIATLEEGRVSGGFGSLVAEVLAEMNPGKTKLIRFGIAGDLSCGGYTHAEARKRMGLDAVTLADKISGLSKGL